MNLDSIAGVTGVMPEESLPSRPLLIVLYGAPGVGKTTLSFTANNPILEDFDGGVERSDQALRPYVIKPQKYSGVKYLTEKVYPVQIPEYGYQTIIIDTGQAMMDGLMTDWVIEQDDRFGTSSGLSRNGWGALGTEFKKRIAFLKSLGLNIIIIAHEKFEGEDEKATPDLKGNPKVFFSSKRICSDGLRLTVAIAKLTSVLLQSRKERTRLDLLVRSLCQTLTPMTSPALCKT
jgi:hypothetical protein